MDLKSIQAQLKNNNRDRLNNNFKSTTTTTVTHATRSRSMGPGIRSDSIARSMRGDRKEKMDAHERFRDRIIHGRDINDVEEELNSVRAKQMKSESMIKMKEEQIIKYKKGLEKAKTILKDMVQSTQDKMKKLQDDVDELQNSLKEKENQLRLTSKQLSVAQSSSRSGGVSIETITKENETLRMELEKYRKNQKVAADRFSGRTDELYQKNQSLHQTNHRLTSELAAVQDKLQRKMREDMAKTSELERLNMRLIELEGGSRSSAQARDLAIGRVRSDMMSLESQLASATKLMEDVEFFVTVKNSVDDYLQDAAQQPNVSDAHRENIFIPKLKSHETFEVLMETSDPNEMTDLSQKLNREVEEDRVNCRRALKELQSKAYILVHNYDEALTGVSVQDQQNRSIMDAFGDIEEMLSNVGEELQGIPVYGDVRDQQDSEIPVNKMLQGFRDSDNKPNVLIFNSLSAQ